jgi:O-antigen ligase
MHSLNSQEHYITSKGDLRLCIFIVGYPFFATLNAALKNSFPISAELWSIMSSITAICGVAVLFVALGTMLRRAPMYLLLSELAFLSVFMISVLYGNVSIDTIIDKAIITCGICIPMAISVICIRDKKFLLRFLYLSSFAFTVIVGYALFFGVGKGVLGSYSQTLGYALLIPIMVQIDHYWDKRKSIDLVFILLGIIALAFYGSRGPLPCLAIYIIWRSITHVKNIVHRITFITLAILLAALFFGFWGDFVNLIAGFLLEYDIKSYTLNRLVSGSIAESQARLVLFSSYIDMIKERPLLGWGVYGGYLGEGLGPHNMVLEYLMAFGVFAGAILVFISALLVLRPFFFKSKNESEQKLLLMYAAYSVRLFFYSGGFLSNYSWFIFVALSLASIKGINQRNEDKKFADIYASSLEKGLQRNA